MRYRQNELNGMLIGDARYPALSFLLSNPTTNEEIRFDTKNTIIVKSNILIIYRVTNGHNDQNNK